MVFNTLNKKILFILLGVLCLPCVVMLTAGNAFLWGCLLFFALALSFLASWVRLSFSFEAVAIYGYLLYGREYKYHAITEIAPRFNDLKNPDIPDELLLKPDHTIRIGIFSPGKRQKIFQELQRQLKTDRSVTENFSPWLKQRQKNKGKQLLAVSIITLLCGIFYTADILHEVWKVETWTPQETVIKERGTKKVRRRRSTTTVDTVRYVYVWKGKIYQGNSILFDTQRLPHGIQPGRQWICLVNPADPSASALTTGRGDRRYKIRFIFPGIILSAGLIVLLFALKCFRKQLPEIPSELLEYMASFSGKEVKELQKKSRFIHSTTNVTVRVPFEIVQNRYGYFPQKRKVWFWIFWAVLFLPFIAGAFYSPIFLLGVLYPGILFICIILPKTAVLDFEERKLFYCTFFRPGKKIKKFLSFDKITCLALTPHPKTGNIQLALVEKDGTMHAIGTAHPNEPALLLASAPQIAERLGHFPVIIV